MPMTELARRYAPWSASMLTSAHACPYQFKLARVVHSERASAASDNQVGLAAHAYLEHRIGVQFAALSPAEAEKAALRLHKLASGELEAFQALMGAADAFVARFRVFCRRENVVVIATEQRWAVDEGFQAVDFKSPSAMFRGVVDLAAVTASGDVYVIDHKSGLVRSAEEKAQQLDAYAAMAVVQGGPLSVEVINGVRCGINALANPGPQQLMWLGYRDRATVRAVQQPALIRSINEAAEQLGDFPARPGKKWPCKYCPYRMTCEYSLVRS